MCRCAHKNLEVEELTAFDFATFFSINSNNYYFAH